MPLAPTPARHAATAVERAEEEEEESLSGWRDERGNGRVGNRAAPTQIYRYF